MGADVVTITYAHLWAASQMLTEMLPLHLQVNPSDMLQKTLFTKNTVFEIYQFLHHSVNEENHLETPCYDIAFLMIICQRFINTNSHMITVQVSE